MLQGLCGFLRQASLRNVGRDAVSVKLRKALSPILILRLISKEIFHNLRKASFGVFAGEHNEKNRLWFLCADSSNMTS